MRSLRSSASLAAVALAVLSGGCGGSQAAQPTEVHLGRAPGDPDPAIAEEEAAKSEKARRPAPAPAPAKEEPAEEPGYLTLICDPPCDEVSHEGRPLGPSPVVRSPLAPGSRRIMVSRGGAGHKIITVIIRSGQTNAVRINMGGAPPSSPAAPTAPTAAAQPTSPTGALSAPTPDMVQMRAQLEPKAWAGRASEDELKLLRALCAYMGDRACRDRAAALLKAQSSSTISP
jgi:hypothetical protein